MAKFRGFYKYTEPQIGKRGRKIMWYPNLEFVNSGSVSTARMALACKTPSGTRLEKIEKHWRDSSGNLKTEIVWRRS